MYYRIIFLGPIYMVSRTRENPYVLQDYLFRPHLYGLQDPRKPLSNSPRVTLGDLTFHCVVEKVK